MLTRRTPDEVTLEIKDPVDPTALSQAKSILSELRPSDSPVVCPSALLSVARRLGDLPEGNDDYIVSSEKCKEAFDGLKEEDRKSLLNIYGRVKAFAEAQRKSVVDVEVDIPGGKAGHSVSPCRAAGCYAPGGRYPLPSSVLMTVVTARSAGCPHVVLASPRPAPITLAAAHVAGADIVLGIGGAQAIGCMAYGISGSDDGVRPPVPPCDVIVGPGNKWVTAAKSLVNGHCGIDMLAGPSEVLVIADGTANAEIVAADLIAQAEHDVVARAILVSDDAGVIDEVNRQVERQVGCLPEPNRSTAMEALKQSFSILCKDMEECIAMSDKLAPEHLEIQTADAEEVGRKCANYGGLFIGTHAAEVLGDYGAGPNHTLPTGGTGRYTGGLSVFNFLRIRTWMRIDREEEAQDMVEDSVRMARLEGLEGHARAAEARSLRVEPAYRKSS
mmetsp:Transcript_26106/g.54022  ORF Transcript_26106/g.54022 Transcript_26106/m.54022 type:complete len:444 (-) Transcript_26106:137-1468(-)|eukprot:CAMPEP_0171345214 /NCGR_PEP_ID=MMETSP0878-20121228/20961_1 /TAXON_ID=67004 /ORGANISM="Thalassiosira weissflogii, Strain CCMP1336" /LENGTH=443 /DNA_ID=CAMNT_0011848567 /DNA_START=283 /DNA_END=1614 /DNA_ORIENTATION=+